MRLEDKWTRLEEMRRKQKDVDELEWHNSFSYREERIDLCISTREGGGADPNSKFVRFTPPGGLKGAWKVRYAARRCTAWTGTPWGSSAQSIHDVEIPFPFRFANIDRP